MLSFVEHLPLLIVVGSIFSAITILIAGWVNKKSAWYISTFTILIQFISSILILKHILTIGNIHYRLGGWVPPWGIEYVVDPLNSYILLIVLFLGLLCVIYSKRNIEHELPEKVVSFYTVYQLLITGLCGVVVTGDIFNMYVFIEIFSLSAYALIASRGKIALRASFNYLILGSIGACFFLIGIGFLYAVTGSLNMHDLSILLPPFYSNRVVMASFVFILVGLSIKMALFPLHTWLPDAHAFAPSEVSAMLSGIIIEVSTYAFIRISFSVFTLNFLKTFPIMDILGWLALVAILFGSIMAISQKNLKRMLAYSSVANMGYIIIALSLSLTSQTPPWGGLNPTLIHIINHALMKACLFLIAGAFIYKADLWYIDKLKHLSRTMPFTCAAFVISALSMIGIPPTVGFVSKLYIILASIEAKKFLFVAIVLLSSLLNLIYFWRIIEIMYMKPEIVGSHSYNSSVSKNEIPLTMSIPIWILASLCILMGIFWLANIPMPILEKVNLLFGIIKKL